MVSDERYLYYKEHGKIYDNESDWIYDGNDLELLCDLLNEKESEILRLCNCGHDEHIGWKRVDLE